MIFKSQGKTWDEVCSQYEPNAPTPGKGLEGQNCNVTACQKPNSAHHFNNVMKAYYCLECAQKIEYWANKDGMSFYEGITGKRD